MDVSRDPRARTRLQALGARSLPIVVQGDRFIWAQNLRDLAAFLDLSDRLPQPLADDELIARYAGVLRAVQRVVEALPPDDLAARVLPTRERTNRTLAAHTHRIAEGFLDTVEHGWVHDPMDIDFEDAHPMLAARDDMLAYGERVIARLEDWQARFRPGMADAVVQTTSGPQTLRWLLERSTLHSAQHARQLQSVVEGKGLVVEGALTPQHLAGLPLPERLFE